MKSSSSSSSQNGGAGPGPATQFALAAAALLLLASLAPAQAGNDNRTPEVPDAIGVPDNNKVHFHAYAVGVQNYVWNGTTWGFTGPEAVLFDADGNVVGIHYAFAGPTRPGWESESGSLVVGAALANAPSSTPNSIPLLLVGVVSASGPGIFARTSYIHRVNTVGGRAPTEPGTSAGQEARVPYTAEYFFYRATK
jgi:hypothetical protein